MDFRLNDEQRGLMETAYDLYRRKLKPLCVDTSPETDRKLREVLAELGMLGLNLPEQYGGQGLPMIDSLFMIQAFAECSSFIGNIMHRSTLGPVAVIAALGTDEQKERFIPPVCRGMGGFSVGITEPHAGSAATAMTTRARIEGDEVVINGSKTFISHALYTDHTLVYCRFADTGSARDIGAVLIPHDAKGFTKSKGFVNMADETQFELYFDDLRLPRVYVIAETNAMARLFAVFNAERLSSLFRQLGVATAAFKYAVEYSKTREQFGQPISNFQGIQWMIADMRVKLDAAQLLIYRAASNAAAGLPAPEEISIAKIYAGQALKEICDDAIQILGGYGYQKEFPVEHYYREIRGSSIYGGTVQMHKNMLAGHVLGRKNSQWKKS